MGELELINAKLYGARFPEEIFGTGADPSIVFRQLAKACHPDHHPAQHDLADRTFAKLSELKRAADDRVKDGNWGKNIPLPQFIPFDIGKYKVTRKPIIGDVCDLYTVEGKDLIVKVARSGDDNDLLRAEAAALTILNKGIDGPVAKGVPWSRVTVDPECVIITPVHRFINRLRENARGNARHGSCGQGVGLAREWQLKYRENILYAEDLWNLQTMRDKLHFLYDLAREEFGADAVAGITTVDELIQPYLHWRSLARQLYVMPKFECAVFEDAQGVLLDEKHGQAPHNTWTNTTFENADTLLDEVGVKDRTRIGCLRTYHTRHGAGPFPTEIEGAIENFPEPHNGTGKYQGSFRIGEFDWNLFEKAIDIVGGVDLLSVSHIDRISVEGAKQFLERIGKYAPVAMRAFGSTAAHRRVELGVYA